MIQPLDDAFLVLDRAGRILDASPLIGEWLGGDAATSVGQWFGDAFPTLTNTHFLRALNAATAERQSRLVELAGPEGHALDARVFPLPQGALVTVADPARKLVSGEADAARLAAIVESSEDAIVSKNLDGVVTSWNRGAERIFGYTAEEMIGQPILRLLPPDRRQEEQLILSRLRAGQRVENFETTRMTKQGNLIDVSLTISPVRDSSGRVIGASKIARDITVQKRADAAASHLAAIVASSDDAIVSKTLDSVVRSWNAGAQRIFGYSPEEAIGRSILFLIPPERHHEERLIISRLRRGERVEHFESQRLHKDGRLIDVSLTISPIRDAAGHIIGASKIARDITERKKAEVALQRLNETLEARVAERTALAEHRARQLRLLASQLVGAEQRERKRIAAALHDDLAQALALANMRLSLLPEPAEQPQRSTLQEVRETVAGAIQAARGLMHDLVPPMLYDVGLAAALRRLADRLHKRHGLRVDVEAVENEQHQIRDDIRSFIFQAVREALYNVLKHSGVKQAAVTLEHDAEGGVRAVVTDQGAGFNASELRQISAGGEHFGLFSLHERAEVMGAAIRIDSAPGQGTQFSLTVPASVARVEEAPVPASPMPAILDAPPPTPSGDPIRIIIADDHAVMRQGLAGLLRGYDDVQVVGQASDGDEALELARKLRPDVVIMDVTMPRLSGLEATRILMQEMPEVRVIGLSMHDEAMAGLMRAAGAAAYLPKDGPAEQIINTIRSQRHRPTAA